MRIIPLPVSCNFVRSCPSYIKETHTIRLTGIIFALLFTVQIRAQNIAFYKTTETKNLYYLKFNPDKILLYKMGRYFYKEGHVPAILTTDTLVKTNINEYKGNKFSVTKTEVALRLRDTKNKDQNLELESDTAKINTELNNAYCIKSYSDLSKKINQEFELYHYSYGNGFNVWYDFQQKSINHDVFRLQTDKEIKVIYDTTALRQRVFARTFKFITENLKSADYSVLKDSLKTFPIDYASQIAYFDRSVYLMAKTQPEYFYRLLQDFPTARFLIYSAVDLDRDLVKELKRVPGYQSLKKDFLKEHRSGKVMILRTFAIYAVFGGLITWLIIAQP